MGLPASPFVGLRAFTPHMSRYFTGRERFALTLSGAVLRSRITVLFGPPGAGKSSVLGAALPMALGAALNRPRKSDTNPTFRMLQFRRWHPGFETRLFRVAAAKLGVPNAESLSAAVTDWSQQSSSPVPVVLVLDQFEEFQLYHPRSFSTVFVRELATIVADASLDVHVVLSLREDALAGLDSLRAVIPGILSAPVQIRPLDLAAAEQAIRAPVATWSTDKFGEPDDIRVEDELVMSLLDQVSQKAPRALENRGNQEVPNSLVDLPILQLALERLWQEEFRGGVTVLRAETLRALGGAAGIARRHLEQTLETLPVVQRELAVRLFRHLVTASGGKHAWRAPDLNEEIVADEEASQLASAESPWVGGRKSSTVRRHCCIR